MMSTRRRFWIPVVIFAVSATIGALVPDALAVHHGEQCDGAMGGGNCSACFIEVDGFNDGCSVNPNQQVSGCVPMPNEDCPSTASCPGTFLFTGGACSCPASGCN